MLAQVTDSASSNVTMAHELSSMFLDAKDSVDWDSSANQIKCYTHKIGLVVKAGLKSLGLSAGHIKPTTSPGITLPTPIMTLNEGNDNIQFDSSEDEEQEDSDPDQEGFDDNSLDSDCEDSVAENASEVAKAVRKVSTWITTSTCFFLANLSFALG